MIGAVSAWRGVRDEGGMRVSAPRPREGSDALLTISSFNKSIVAWMSSGPHQAPAGWKSWAESAADKNVVVEIPDRCLASGRIVKQIIGFAVTVKVGCGD